MIAAVVAFIMYSSPVLAAEPVVFEGFSSEQPCKTVDEAPICVAKAWEVCTNLGGDICKLIGLPVEPLTKTEADLPAYPEEDAPRFKALWKTVITTPWTMPSSDVFFAVYGFDIFNRAGILGIERVEPKRFRRGGKIPEGFEGAVEVAIYTNIGDSGSNSSLFVKNLNGKWVVIGQHYASVDYDGPWDEGCDPGHASRAPATCAMFIYGLRPYESIRVRKKRDE